MKTKEKDQFIDSVVGALRKAATEMEEFQVKVALGKAEALDKYEEIKKKLNLLIHEGKFQIKEGKEKIEDINAKFDEIRIQLALGKAETIEEFKKQKKQLLLTLHDLEVKIKTNETLKRIYAVILIEIETFKIQLEILEEKFEEKRDVAKISFEKGKEEFNSFVNKFKTKHQDNEETEWEDFQGEVSQAFIYLKKVFKKPD